jgi:hypothetical protein
MVEFALVFPLFALVMMGVITLGLYVFYQQQVTNVAREAARYAAIHSSTAQCPTVSWQTPQAPPLSYYRCDSPEDEDGPWPAMAAHARQSVWGVAPSLISIAACWSGFRIGASGLADDPAVISGTPTTYVQCTMRTPGSPSNVDPVGDPASLSCPVVTTSVDDPASDIPNNRVTVYACFKWAPPMAGFLLMPSEVTMRAVVTEVIQRQQ